MDTDENAPPSKDEKTTPGMAGMLSAPFGFLAGVRSMLSPSVKDPLSDSPIVTGRPALRDANASATPNQKSYKTGAQGPGAPAEATGDALLSTSWQERGDRTSVASENSFVSALSSGNTSLPDGLLLASPTSDTDTSTAYESAGETEGNGSVFEEALISSEGVLLNRPIAVSSPYEVNQLNETFEIGAKTSLNETVQLEDSEGSCADPLSVSYLVDHLGSLSLSTPLKLNNDESHKGHVTLASDVSGDLNSSSEHDSMLGTESDLKSLDVTITLAEGDEKDIQVIPQEDSCKLKETNLPKDCLKTQDLNRTVDIASDTSSSNSSGVEVEQPDADSEISAAALKELEGLSDSLNFASLNQSELSDIEAKLLEGLNETYHSPPFANGRQSLDYSTANESDLSTILLDRLNESEAAPALFTNNIYGSPRSHADKEHNATLNETVVEVAIQSPSKPSDETRDPSSHEPVTVPSKLPEDISNSTVLVQDSLCPEVSSQPETAPEAVLVNCQPKLDELSDTPSSSQELLPIPGEANSYFSGELRPEENEVTQEVLSSFEEAPLPVKVPRSFDEILAEQLGAAGQTEDLSSADPNKVYPTVASSFDDAPLPARKQRTFTELLDDELAAQNLNSEPEPVPADKTSAPLVAENNPYPPSELMPDSNISLEESVPSESVETCIASESSPDSVEAVEVEAFHSETLAPSESDEVPIPIKPPRTFQEILDAQLEAQGDPEHAVPTFSSEFPTSVPIRNPPRTFDEILNAALASQSDPKQAVPSSLVLKAGQAYPRKLNESYVKLISSESSSIEAESEPEPVLVSDITHGEEESESSSGLDLLIEKCKLQEQDLELGESEFKDLADEAGRLSMSCLNESQRANSVESEESLASDFANRTVIRVDLESSPVFKSPQASVQVQPQSPQIKASAAESELGSGCIDEDQFISGEDAFVDASGFDFLSQRGGPCIARDFRKESLYVKFDPLVGSLSDSFSTMHPENSSDNQSGQTAVADEGQQSSEMQSSASEKLVSLSPSSSKQVTAPTTPLRGLVKSTAVKTPAHVMLNETLESIGSRGTSIQQEDLIKKLQEHQSVLEEQDKAYQERIAELEQRLQEMDVQSHRGDESLQQQLLEKERQLQEKERQFQEKAQSLVELNLIMKEYEKTISRLVAEKSQEKAAFDEKQVDLVKERDQAAQHLNNMEIAFSDIHTKYERLKSIVETFKKNEETLNTALSEKQANYDKMESMYNMLKSHAVSKLEKANQDLEAIKQKHQQENAKLKAMIKKLEIKTKSLEDTLEQKVKENQALTAICDELINKVGE